MPQYGQLSYWTDRYSKDDVPFDWMSGYYELRITLSPLLQEAAEDASKSILVAGCGNASFSIDLFNDGYVNVINIDYCDVVIQQQKRKYPQIDWRVVNALCMDEFEDGQFDYIIDKSLSDTTLCYKSGVETTRLLFTEFHRVLKPGGRIITISLHGESDVTMFSRISDTMAFAVSTGSLASNREKANPSSSQFHTVAVFDKLTGLSDEEKYDILVQHPLVLGNTFLTVDSDEKYDNMDDLESIDEWYMKGIDDNDSDEIYDDMNDVESIDERQMKGIVDDYTSLEELITLYNTVVEEYSKLIELTGEGDYLNKLKY